MRILVLGKDGQLGRCLLASLSPLGEVIGLGSSEVDLRQVRLLRDVVREVFPDLVVIAAAYTAVDRAESDVETAMAINAAAPGVLAEEAERIGAGVIHYSTDYVFDGLSRRPYREEDSPNPLSTYGESKLLGERAIQATGAAHLILRVGWLYGSRGGNFFTTMLRLARERDVLQIVDDQIIGPTWVKWVAGATASILLRIDQTVPHAVSNSLRQRGGLYHFVSMGQTTPFRFAQSILRRDPWASEHRVQRLEEIRLDEYVAPAARPQFCVLDSFKAEDQLGVQRTSWEGQLGECWAAVSADDSASFREASPAP